MCRYCVEYGNGTKWYLNPENYRRELYNAPGHSHAFNSLAGVGKNSFEVGGLLGFEDKTPDYRNHSSKAIVGDKMLQHTGQVVPLSDAIKILESVPDDEFLLMHCACRRYFGRDDLYSCLFFGPTIEKAKAERPWETDSRIISRAEAIKMEKEWDKLGLVHNILDAGTDSDGKPPIVMCHCNTTDCLTGQLLGMGTPGLRKGEYVAVVDRKLCSEGCTNYPACMSRCSFGAMRYNPIEKVCSVELGNCFGCGVCQSVCPTKAIKLVDRLSYPALADIW